MGQTTVIWRSAPMGHTPPAARLDSRLPGMFTFTLLPWTRRVPSRETSKRSSIENIWKVLNLGGDQDHWVKNIGIIASACGEMTRRTVGVDMEAALDSTTSFTIAGPHSEGLASAPALGPLSNRSRESVWLRCIHSDVEETCLQWHSTTA